MKFSPIKCPFVPILSQKSSPFIVIWLSFRLLLEFCYCDTTGVPTLGDHRGTRLSRGTAGITRYCCGTITGVLLSS